MQKEVGVLTDKKMWISLSLIFFVAGLLMFSFIGLHPLMDPDEPVYAETAREMLKFQDFISPRIYGEFWYDKPPMYYWLVAISISFFGDNEFAARFPSALLAVGGAILIYFAGRKLFNERAALLAALILTTMLEYFYLGNAAVTDMTLTFCLTAALLAFLLDKTYLLFLFAALATMTKGPVAIAFCVGIIFLYQVLSGNIKTMTINYKKIVGGAGLFLLITGPWYWIMYQLHGTEFIDTFLGFHNITRFLQPEHASGADWYYYIPVILVGLFPWTAVMFQALKEGLKKKSKDYHTCLFLFIWASLVFVFFSISQTKLVSYILPLYPPLALLLGHYFDKTWQEKRYRALKHAAWGFSIMAGLLCAGLFYAGKSVSQDLIVSIQVIIGIFSLSIIMVIIQSFRRSFRAVLATQIISAMMFFAILMTQALNLVSPGLSVKQFAEAFSANYDGKSEVYVMKFYRPGFAYYSGLAGKELTIDELKTIINDQEQKVYLVMKKANYEKLAPELKANLKLLVEQEDKVLLVHEKRLLAWSKVDV